jgi:L-aspartate oxidase
MEDKVGVIRSRESLTEAMEQLLPLARGEGAASDPATIGLFIAIAALLRTESRGGHWRSDFPDALAAQACRQVLDLADIEVMARRVTSKPKTLAVAG